MNRRARPTSPQATGKNIFDRISRERQSFIRELKRISRVDERKLVVLKKAFSTLRKALTTHWDAVEKTLHETLLEEQDSNEIHAQILEEREFRHLADIVAAELTEIPPCDPRWRAKFAVFTELLSRYAEKTGTHLKQWRQELGPIETEMLGLRFEKRYRALNHPLKLSASRSP